MIMVFKDLKQKNKGVIKHCNSFITSGPPVQKIDKQHSLSHGKRHQGALLTGREPCILLTKHNVFTYTKQTQIHDSSPVYKTASTGHKETFLHTENIYKVCRISLRMSINICEFISDATTENKNNVNMKINRQTIVLIKHSLNSSEKIKFNCLTMQRNICTI